MIRLSGIEKSFGNKRVLRGISMTVETGRIFAVMGPSGSGKSTLLRCVNFLERPTRGAIEAGGRTIDANTATSRDILFLRNRTAMVFQQFNLFQNLTVTGNVMLGLTDVKKMNRRVAREESLRLLDRVGLSDKADYYPSQLSGGQQQRVGIARALAMKPDVLLLDEPTSALDPELIEDVLRCIINVAADVNSMIIVTHELGFAREAANTIVFIDDGVVIEETEAQAFFRSPSSERAECFLKNSLRRHINPSETPLERAI
ncbi:MAG: amino acid ABC transporter ATP-binding protein [Synergistaceae bacterium]|jgi:L-cystine transport system ATP-binding protein|nr:amino acid ABC transporter ATP-binding protein [Synergistaceae bacterium]